MAKTISIVNFKGGVGKTTLAFHLAAFLARNNGKVLVVDVDHQSSLSIIMLKNLYDPLAQAGKTSNAVFQSFVERNVSMPGTEIICRNPMSQRMGRSAKIYDLYPNLDVVPAQLELDDTEIELAATTYGSAARSEWEKRTLLCAWLDKIKAAENYDYIIFDCPPATKLVSQNALAASEYYVIPVIPDEVSARGVTHFRNLVSSKIDAKLEALRHGAQIAADKAPTAYYSSTKLAGIVAFMAKPAGRAASGLTNLHTQQIGSLRRRWKGDLLNSSVRHMTGVPESLSAGWPVFNQGGNKNVANRGLSKEFSDVCKEIADRLV